MNILNDTIAFPDVSQATKDGLLAIGGDLQPERLILAYKSGIFPWFDDDRFIMWWSPDPRFVLYPEKLKVSKSMKSILKKDTFDVTTNKAFGKVINECANINRPGQIGTWITDSMIKSYKELHAMGLAKSVEVWQNDALVGGLYGVDLGNGVFCGESMFAKVDNASKVGFITFVKSSHYKLIDCQVYTKHLESLGAEEVSRDDFIKVLN